MQLSDGYDELSDDGPCVLLAQALLVLLLVYLAFESFLESSPAYELHDKV